MDDLNGITQLLAAMNDPAGEGELAAALYAELRQMAAAKMSAERPDHTLQPTALVHEAWLRLQPANGARWENRRHFFGAAGEAMRRILVESARRRKRLKRGGDQCRVEYEESAIKAPVEDERVLLVDEALDKLAGIDPLRADIVKLRFFAGMGHEEIAKALGVSEKTVRRHWSVAKVLLIEMIREDAPLLGGVLGSGGSAAP